jgi:hypothetical protein
MILLTLEQRRAGLVERLVRRSCIPGVSSVRQPDCGCVFFYGDCDQPATATYLRLDPSILQSLEESENIGYIIPSVIVRRLIDDYDSSSPTAAASSDSPSLCLRGFAEFPVFTQVCRRHLPDSCLCSHCALSMPKMLHCDLTSARPMEYPASLYAACRS